MFFDLGIIKGAIDEHNAFIEMCKTLPKEEADKLKSARREIAEDSEAHRRSLEIANASRPRNFWGQ